MLSIVRSIFYSSFISGTGVTQIYRQHRLKYLPSISTTIGLEVFSTAALSPVQGLLRSIDNIDLNIYRPFQNNKRDKRRRTKNKKDKRRKTKNNRKKKKDKQQ
jgi:hypothetical protein